ncbi:winged helix-turn-helix transcriptional regulator [Halomonas sp. Bachu 37]|uniref:hypothetical protein n=1 Tax=Halomonas kashgarensis TaxID=3084920 RepID=UPI0032162354
MRDIRSALSEDKHYINAPIPLFLHLCSLDITRAQANIFWLHWGEGQMHGDWKSEIPIKTVADRLSLSVSTVKRAYQDLESLGLIRRHRQGRSLRNPMRMAITITEVTIPDDVADQLLEAPNRAKSRIMHQPPEASAEPETTMQALPEAEHAPEPEITNERPEPPAPKYVSIDDDEETNRPVTMEWLKLQAEIERETAREKQKAQPHCEHEQKPILSYQTEEAIQARERRLAAIRECFAKKKRKIYPGMAYKMLNAIRDETQDERCARQSWHEMLWSLEHGLFSDMPVRKGYNIMMNLLRRKDWSYPSGMPEGWAWPQP